MTYEREVPDPARVARYAEAIETAWTEVGGWGGVALAVVAVADAEAEALAVEWDGRGDWEMADELRDAFGLKERLGALCYAPHPAGISCDLRPRHGGPHHATRPGAEVHWTAALGCGSEICTEICTDSNPSPQLEQIRREVWADVAATLNDRAVMWDAEGPRRGREAAECHMLANAYRTYAEGVGIPAMDALRTKRAAAEAKVAKVEALADDWAGLEHDAVACPSRPWKCPDCTMLNAIHELRAALADAPAEQRAEGGA